MQKSVGVGRSWNGGIMEKWVGNLTAENARAQRKKGIFGRFIVAFNLSIILLPLSR
jgi:hypothetical protein